MKNSWLSCSALLLATGLGACSRAESVREQVANPQAGDVYVVQFQPQGGPAKRYFFYQLYRVTPDSAYLHPARTDSPTPDAALPGMFALEKSLPYTHAELLELLQEQPGDVQKTRLLSVRRGQ